MGALVLAYPKQQPSPSPQTIIKNDKLKKEI
jgi:hypothetical protein